MEEQSTVDYKILGSKIKQKRLSLGLTQEKMAEKLDLNESFISRIERGERLISLENLVKIANFFDLSLDYLLIEDLPDYDNKLMVEIDAIFRDKSPRQADYLLNLLKVHSENIGRLLP